MKQKIHILEEPLEYTEQKQWSEEDVIYDWSKRGEEACPYCENLYLHPDGPFGKQQQFCNIAQCDCIASNQESAGIQKFVQRHDQIMAVCGTSEGGRYAS
jgi:hypothetical protein